LSDLGHHAEWLSLIDVSGPFLAEPVLKDAFPQGLEGLDSAKRTMVRQAYDEWREALDLDRLAALVVVRLRNGWSIDAYVVRAGAGNGPDICERAAIR